MQNIAGSAFIFLKYEYCIIIHMSAKTSKSQAGDLVNMYSGADWRA